MSPIAELGETTQPRELVPGSPQALRTTAHLLDTYGDALARVGDGLRGIDDGGWHGDAADAFHATFDGEPSRWVTCGDCFLAARDALNEYAGTLAWAQQQATTAIDLWNQGERATEQARAQQEDLERGESDDPGQELREQARTTLASARNQVQTAGDAAAEAIDTAQRPAPEEPGILERAVDGIQSAVADVVDGVQDAFDAVTDTVGAVVDDVLDFAGETVDTALDVGGDVVGGDPGDDGDDPGDPGDGDEPGDGEEGDDGDEGGGDQDGGDQDGGGEADRNGHWEDANGDKPDPEDISAQEARGHILYGDGDGEGGGHRHDSGVPNKTTFPEDWDDDKIIDEVEDVAQNPDEPPVYDEDDETWTVHGTRDGVDIEVIVTPDGEVKTGYPTGGEGVHRNDENGDPQPVN